MEVNELIERVRAICLALPEATEKIAWGEPTWRVGKIFAMLSTFHHGDPHLSVICNAEEGVQESLVRADPKHFYRPPYVGGAGWIGVRLDTGLDWGVVASLISAAYRVTAPKRLLKRLDEERATPPPAPSPSARGRGPRAARPRRRSGPSGSSPGSASRSR